MPNFKVKRVPLNANTLTQGVKGYIRLHGGDAWRINTMGVYDAERGVFRPVPEEDKGVSDVIGTYRGFSIYIEVKIDKDRQSPAQIKFQKRAEAVGAWYCIAKNMQDFIKDFDQFKIKIDKLYENFRTL